MRTFRPTTTLAVASAFLATLLSATPATSVLPVDGPRFVHTRTSSLVPGSPMPHETVAWNGTATAKSTKVTLQVAVRSAGRSRWQDLSTSRTTGEGAFSVRVTGAKEAGAVTRYRLVRTKRPDAGSLAAVRVPTVAQTAVLDAPTPVVGTQFTMTAHFTPVRKGRRVVVQSFDGTRWANSSWGNNQRKDGTVTYRLTALPEGNSILYRFAAYPYGGTFGIYTNEVRGAALGQG